MSGGIGRTGRGAVGRSERRRRVGVGLFGGAPWASLYLPPSPFCLGPNDVREREHTAFLPIGGRRAFSSPVHGGEGRGPLLLQRRRRHSLPPSSLRRGMSSLPSMACDAPRKGGGGRRQLLFPFPTLSPLPFLRHPPFWDLLLCTRIY